MIEGIGSVDELIAAVPWPRLTTAYDVALEAPAHLRALAAAADAGTSEGLDDLDDWLFTSVVHQGMPYSATAPVLWIARRILGAGSTHPALGSVLLVVEECATALRWVAHGDDGKATDRPHPYRNPPGDPLWASYLPAGREIAPSRDHRVNDDYFITAPADVITLSACLMDWKQTVLDCLRDRRFLNQAIACAGAMVRFEPTWTELIDALRLLVNSGEAVESRAAAAFALAASGATAAGIDALVDNDDRAVQFAAALGCPDHPRALQTLLTATSDRAWVDRTFPHGFTGPDPWLHAALISSVLDRVTVAEAGSELIDGLEQQLMTVEYGPFGATYEWGPVLAWLLPDRWQQSSHSDVPSPTDLSHVQRRLLAALVHNNDPWERGEGNASVVLGRVGLPHNRASLAKLVGINPSRRRRFLKALRDST